MIPLSSFWKICKSHCGGTFLVCPIDIIELWYMPNNLWCKWFWFVMQICTLIFILLSQIMKRDLWQKCFCRIGYLQCRLCVHQCLLRLPQWWQIIQTLSLLLQSLSFLSHSHAFSTFISTISLLPCSKTTQWHKTRNSKCATILINRNFGSSRVTRESAIAR